MEQATGVVEKVGVGVVVGVLVGVEVKVFVGTGAGTVGLLLLMPQDCRPIKIPNPLSKMKIKNFFFTKNPLME